MDVYSLMAKRLFVAIDLPDVTRGFLADLDPHIRGVRWTDPTQMHLTLGFFGGAEDLAPDSTPGHSGQSTGQSYQQDRVMSPAERSSSVMRRAVSLVPGLGGRRR